MKRRTAKDVATACFVFTSILLGALSCSAPAIQPAPSLSSQLEAEIVRLDGLVVEHENAELPGVLKGVPKPASSSLERSKAASSDLLRLYRLRDPFTAFEAFSFIVANAEASADLESFGQLWKSSEARFETPSPDDATHALQRGLVQAAGNRAEKLYRASTAYAKIDSPSSGLYYLAEAHGNLKFREFVASLDLPAHETGSQINRESLGLALDAIEDETLKVFGDDPGANSMIPVSVRLKEARELFDAGLLEGSAIMLIESRLALSTRPGAGAVTPAAGDEETSSDGIRSMLVAMLDGEDASRATVVRNELIPLYDSLALDRSASPSAQSLVTVTLVRWPYT